MLRCSKLILSYFNPLIGAVLAHGPIQKTRPFHLRPDDLSRKLASGRPIPDMLQPSTTERMSPCAFYNTSFGRNYNSTCRCELCSPTPANSTTYIEQSQYSLFDAFRVVPAVSSESPSQQSERFPKQGSISDLAALRIAGYGIIADMVGRAEYEAPSDREVQAYLHRPLPPTPSVTCSERESKSEYEGYNGAEIEAQASQQSKNVDSSAKHGKSHPPAWTSRIRKRAEFALKWLSLH